MSGTKAGVSIAGKVDIQCIGERRMTSSADGKISPISKSPTLRRVLSNTNDPLLN